MYQVQHKIYSNTAQFPPDGLSTVPAAAAPCSPYRYLELCGIALYYFTYYYVYPYHLAFINFFHLFCLRIVNTTFVGWFLLVILEPMNVDYIILLHLLLCRC